MKILKLSAVMGAAMLAAPTAMASSILIDDFSVFQEAADLPTATAGSPTLVVNAGLFGGSRFFSVQNTSGGGSGGTELVSTGNGQAFQQTPENTLVFTNDTSQTGVATVIYDGRTTLNQVGSTFAATDLTNGGVNTKFFFDLVEDTPNFVGASFTTTVTDGNNNSSTFVEQLDLGFSEFTEFSSFGGIDFTQVTSLAFTFDTNTLAGFDGGISSISVVPLPLSAFLLLGGLGGLVGVSTVSKRRRRA